MRSLVGMFLATAALMIAPMSARAQQGHVPAVSRMISSNAFFCPSEEYARSVAEGFLHGGNDEAAATALQLANAHVCRLHRDPRPLLGWVTEILATYWRGTQNVLVVRGELYQPTNDGGYEAIIVYGLIEDDGS